VATVAVNAEFPASKHILRKAIVYHWSDNVRQTSPADVPLKTTHSLISSSVEILSMDCLLLVDWHDTEISITSRRLMRRTVACKGFLSFVVLSQLNQV